MSEPSLPPIGALVRGRMREYRTLRGVVVEHGADGMCCVMLLSGRFESVPGWNLEVVQELPTWD